MQCAFFVRIIGMNDVKLKLIEEAKKRDRSISPCAHFDSFWDCFTIHEGKLLFWYNDKEGSTRIVSTDMLSDME